MSKRGARILVVDDSPNVVTSLCKVLEINGYRVDSAFNGSDALRKIQKQNFDLVICDIEMPGLTGLDFLQRVRRDFGRDLDVILMTGFLEPEYFIQAIRLGASDFINKPVESNQIVAAVRALLENKRSKDNLPSIMPLIDQAEFRLVINPLKFSQFGISKALGLFLRQNLNLQQNALNELLICVDEMIYNAFIHGTLGLDTRQRQFDHGTLQKIIAEKLQEAEVAVKRIHFIMSINQAEESVSICVKDDGNGFDYQSWLQRVASEPQVNLESHGRGLSMLYRLCDKLDFFDEGRTVQITRKLNLASSSEQ